MRHPSKSLTGQSSNPAGGALRQQRTTAFVFVFWVIDGPRSGTFTALLCLIGGWSASTSTFATWSSNRIELPELLSRLLPNTLRKLVGPESIYSFNKKKKA
eukprot:Platyproteum_vivax@DN6560_c0_g1_i3.p1